MAKPRATACVDCGSPEVGWTADYTAHWKGNPASACCRCHDCWLTWNRERYAERRALGWKQPYKTKADTPCARCGKPRGLGQRKYCVECAVEAEREKDRARVRQREGRIPGNWTRPCRNCGVPFTDKGNRMYCGDGCKVVAAIARRRPPAPPKAPPLPAAARCCAFCGLNSGRKKWCGEACFNHGKGRARNSVEVTYGECRRCGKLYCREAAHDNGMCSARCTLKQTRKRRKAGEKARRKARLRFVEVEDFTLREIAERDAWRCHLCGGSVPDRPYSARDKDPTLDHLIPVSKGGPHTRSNVALAHNRCNWERRDADIEFQPRLIA